MHRIPVREIMRSAVITIEPDVLAADAAELMDEFNIRRLPVVNEEGCLVGIVTDTDVLEAETAGSVLSSYEQDPENEWLDVADIMSREVVTITPDRTVGELATVLMQHKISGVPVIDESTQQSKCVLLLGIVTEMDIFKMIAEAWREEERNSHR